MTAPFQMIVTVNSRDVDAVLAGLELVLSDDAMDEFLLGRTGDYIRDRMRARFANEGDDVTGAWQPLQPATVSIRQGLGYPGPHPINVRTGDMENYLLGDRGAITGPTTWEYPSPGLPNDIQQKIQTAQAGAALPPTVPRPVLGMSNVDEVAIVADLEDYIRGALIMP